MALGLSLNLLSSAVRQAGRMLQQRHFTTLTAAGGMYYALATPKTLSGDFEIEFDSTIPITSSCVIGSSTQSTEIRLESAVSNRVRVVLNGYFNDFNNALDGLNFNALNRFRILKTGTALFLYVNDVQKGEQFNDIASSFNMIAQNGAGARYFSGIISNLTIKQSGVLTNSWALDSDGTTSTEIDSVGGNNATRVNMTAADTELFTKDGADWVGVELITNGGFDDWISDNPVGWITTTETVNSYVTENAGSARIVSIDGSYISIRQIVAAIGNRYRLTADIVDVSSGSIIIYCGSTIYNYTDTGSFKNDFTASNVPIEFKRASGATDSSIDNISIKRLIEVA